jgi:hypothetical protein
MKHVHHIIPRYLGGTDDPSNLVELTVEEHAEAHRKLYEQHGNWQDKVAWQGLAGLIGHDEIMREMWNSRKGEKNSYYGKKHTPEIRKKISEACKGKQLETKKPTVSKALKERWKTQDHFNKGKEPWNKGKTGVQNTYGIEHALVHSKPCRYNGNVYHGIGACAKANNTTKYKIEKLVEWISVEEYRKYHEK